MRKILTAFIVFVLCVISFCTYKTIKYSQKNVISIIKSRATSDSYKSLIQSSINLYNRNNFSKIDFLYTYKVPGMVIREFDSTNLPTSNIIFPSNSDSTSILNDLQELNISEEIIWSDRILIYFEDILSIKHYYLIRIIKPSYKDSINPIYKIDSLNYITN